MREAFASDLLSVARNIVTWIDDNDGDGGRKAVFAPLFDTKPNNGALGYHIGLKALDLTWLRCVVLASVLDTHIVSLPAAQSVAASVRLKEELYQSR